MVKKRQYILHMYSKAKLYMNKKSKVNWLPYFRVNCIRPIALKFKHYFIIYYLSSFCVAILGKPRYQYLFQKYRICVKWAILLLTKICLRNLIYYSRWKKIFYLSWINVHCKSSWKIFHFSFLNIYQQKRAQD